MNDLSICIPTYERWSFAAWTLAKTKKDFPDAQIVLSDNASSSKPPFGLDGVRYIRQARNIGAFPNLRAALLAGQRKYVTYLADDDYLLPDEVQRGVRFLEANPHVVAYYAPCQLYNEIEQKYDWDAFYVVLDETFTEPDKLWNFVIKHHVWPEHVIWRREGLEKILLPRVREYWCFIDLAMALAQGAVHFAKTPFYRNITGHPVGARVKMGDQQCLTDFDQYRGGLEIMAFELFKDCLKEKDFKAEVNAMITQFINVRLATAHRLHRMCGREDAANAIAKRLAVCSDYDIRSK